MPSGSKDFGSFDTDEHPDTGKHCWIWTGPGGQEHRGLYQHDDPDAALDAGRDWLKGQIVETG